MVSLQRKIDSLSDTLIENEEEKCETDAAINVISIYVILICYNYI